MDRRLFAGGALSFLCSSPLLATAQQMAAEGKPKPKVLVNFAPDRPMDWFVDALPMRIIGLPWQERSERVAIPGLDFQGLALTSFCEAATRTWPMVEFVRRPDIALRRSEAVLTEIQAQPWPGRFPPATDELQLLAEEGVIAIVELEARWAGDSDRPRPYGAVCIALRQRPESLIKSIEELTFKGSLQAFLQANITEVAPQRYAGKTKRTFLGQVLIMSERRFGPDPHDHLPWLTGSRDEVVHALSKRGAEVVAFLQQSFADVWQSPRGMSSMKDNLATSRERQPYFYTLPF